MRNPFRTTPKAEPGADPVGRDDADTLSQIRRLTVNDERPTREDRRYGETIFTRPPVALPRMLTGKRRSTRR
jgi:hypothetical protein